ncbi:hypothetical protein [Actinophytocola sp.]|uniref:hypothetical protein n=1 Tax=Actinophytocola sp. TaxID=1872138 RepID=UPI002D7F8592|nr:hypothetical protein [Actinophytocola sp.]HET9141563.1 hypothetical protein [Actinophytocola sp.]
MVRVSGHAYPWDVVGDVGFPARVGAAGITEVTLAAAYHSTRAATPLHPGHQVVEARDAALYRPVRQAVWGARRLRPVPADWVPADDPFGVAAEALRRAGLGVVAWVVLPHNTRLGREFPELAVVNCVGDRYPYALCPAQEEVREYAATLAVEAVAGVAVDGVSLEACGQLGIEHNSHHEKTAGVWSATASRALSVCCCVACRAGWTERGLVAEEVLAALRQAVHRDVELPGELAGELLGVRHRGTDLLRGEVLAALRAVAPGVPVTVHADPDPWATGASPGLTSAAAAGETGLLVPAWPTGPASAAGVAVAGRGGAPVDAYVTVLPPAEPADLPGHVERLVAAGVRGLNLYHLGLAGRERQELLAGLVEALQ